MRLTLHTRIELGLAALLLLGSCGSPSLSEKQKEEVADLADDAAPDTSALESRIGQLESDLQEVRDDAEKVDEVESRLSGVDSRLSDVEGKLGM